MKLLDTQVTQEMGNAMQNLQTPSNMINMFFCKVLFPNEKLVYKPHDKRMIYRKTLAVRVINQLKGGAPPRYCVWFRI